MKILYLNSCHEVQLSDEDFIWALGWTWRLVKGYPSRNVKKRGTQKIVYLHLEVAKRASIIGNPEIDHKDRNPLNCMRANLRPATSSQQKMNRSSSRRASTGVRLRGRKWYAYGKKDGRQIHLGVFESKQSAAIAYEKHVSIHHGEFKP